MGVETYCEYVTLLQFSRVQDPNPWIYAPRSQPFGLFSDVIAFVAIIPVSLTLWLQLRFDGRSTEVIKVTVT